MKKGRLIALFALALAAIPPSQLAAQSGTKGTVKVGMLMPLTGNTAWAGKTNRIAAQIAVVDALRGKLPNNDALRGNSRVIGPRQV